MSRNEIDTDLQGDTGTERELKPKKKFNSADYLVTVFQWLKTCGLRMVNISLAKHLKLILLAPITITTSLCRA